MSNCMRSFVLRRGRSLWLLAALAVWQVQVSTGQEPADQSKEAARAAELRELVEALDRDLHDEQAANDHLWEIALLRPPVDVGLPVYVPLLRHESRDVRARALATIAGYGPAAADAVDEVLAVLQHEGDEIWRSSERVEAIRTLGEIGRANPRLVEVLAGYLNLSTNKAMEAIVATRALGNFGPNAASALPQLRALLDSDKEFVKHDAYEAIGRIAARPLPDDDEAPRLLADVASLEPAEGYALLEWLREKPKLAAPHQRQLIHAYWNRECPIYVRYVLVETMHAWSKGDYSAVKILMDSFENKAPHGRDPRLSGAAATSLWKIQSTDDNVVNLLIPRLNGSDHDDFRMLLTLLARLGPLATRADAALASLLESEAVGRSSIRFHACLEAVQAIGPGCDRCAAVLAKLLADARAEERPAAGRSRLAVYQFRIVFVLAELGVEALAAAHKELLDLFHETERSIEFAVAARALSILGDSSEEVVSELVASLQQEAFRIRSMDSQLVIDRWGPYPGDPEFTTTARLEVIAALGRLGPTAGEAVPALERIVERERDKAAAKARLTPEEAVLQEVGLLEALPPDADLKQVVADLEASPYGPHRRLARPRFVPDELAAAEAALAAIRGER